jgi:hypothetical protein
VTLSALPRFLPAAPGGSAGWGVPLVAIRVALETG